MRWQVREAKQRFSEVLRAAEAGEPVSLMEYLRAEPLLGDDFVIDRQRELPREIDLTD